VNDLVFCQMATGFFAIGSFSQNRRPVFIPRDGIRFSTREAAETELRAERDKPTDIGGVMV